MSCAGGELHGDTVEAMLARLRSRRRYRGSELDGRELDRAAGQGCCWTGESWTGLLDGRVLDGDNGTALLDWGLLDGRQLDSATGR